MQPEGTASRYDQIATWWQTQHQNSLYGVRPLKQAIRFTPKRRFALDVGCGSSGRFISVLSEHDFQTEGLDISKEMIRLARHLHPDVVFYQEDICRWTPQKHYSLIAAWDSTFHLPLNIASEEDGVK